MTDADARRWRVAAAAGWMVIAAWAAYVFAPVVRGYFLSDDFVPLVLFNKWQEEGNFWSMLWARFTAGVDAGANNFYRPLSYLTLGLQYYASGVDPMPWMAASVLLHVANAILVAAIAVEIAGGGWNARNLAAGAIGAALFLFFAPGVEVAAWISGRFDVMATLFTLAACLAFLKSRRALDGMAWMSLASFAGACLSKESAAIVPLAIVILAWLREDADRPWKARWMRAIRAALPWLVLAAAYLLLRYLVYGNATRVYGGSRPLSALLSPGYWSEMLTAIPAYLSAQFRGGYRYPFLVALTAGQLLVVYLARTDERRGRDAVFASFLIAVFTIALVLPHVSPLPADGLGGRLLYQTAAFYAIFSAVALRHVRLAYLLWGVCLALVLLHAAFHWSVVARWNVAFTQTRALVEQIRQLQASQAPGEYALVLVPGLIADGVPFGNNAQGGFMLPPVMPPGTSRRVLVQIAGEVPQLAAKVREGVVTTLRERSVFDYLDGKRIAATPPETPTRVLCWNPRTVALLPLDVAPGGDPEGWMRAVQRALALSPCPKA